MSEKENTMLNLVLCIKLIAIINPRKCTKFLEFYEESFPVDCDFLKSDENTLEVIL